MGVQQCKEILILQTFVVCAAGVFLGYLVPACIVSERHNNLYAPVCAMKLQAKCLQRSPGAVRLRVLPKWPINYLLTCFEYLQPQQMRACINLMTLRCFTKPDSFIL